MTALEAAVDVEFLRHLMLLRVRAKGALTIERFGPPEPALDRAAASRKHSNGKPVVTPLVVTWVLSVGAAALRRRAPVVESDDVTVGNRILHYRCAVVPVAGNGVEVDALVGVLGYRWASRGGPCPSNAQ